MEKIVDNLDNLLLLCAKPAMEDNVINSEGLKGNFMTTSPEKWIYSGPLNMTSTNRSNFGENITYHQEA